MVSLSVFKKKKTPEAASVPPPVPAKEVASITKAPPTPPSQTTSYPSLIDEYAGSSSQSASSSKNKLRPPAINTDQPVLSAPTSPLSRRSTSSFSRHPPASFIRHSRVLSGSSTLAGDIGAIFSPSQSLRNRQKTIITDLPQELSPVVNLSNAQRLRQYVAGPISVLSEDESTWFNADATLTGSELSLWIAGSAKPRYLNLQDCKIIPSKTDSSSVHDLRVLHDYDANVTTLRFEDATEMHTWLAAIQLAKFEHTSLNEAFTAVMLSLKGRDLSDIYTLLSHKKKFTRFEWCNVRLPQVSNKWIKVFMAIVPADNKRNGRVEIYSSDKITKKNLVMYINDVTSVFNVYPEDHNMIDYNSIMKLEGEVFVNKQFESLFGSGTMPGSATPTSPKLKSRPNSSTSLTSFTAPPMQHQQSGSRSRSTSINSSSSFFVNAPSPNPEGITSTPSSPTKSNHFFKKQSSNHFVATNYLYMMPQAHPGVSAIEIMLRNFVHIIDAFKLYGRPTHLSSDKKDTISMLFGLPSLPHYGYLDIEDAYGVVAANFDTAVYQNWGQGEWRNSLKEYLSCKQRDGEFTGVGNIYELFNSLEYDSDEASYSDRAISPIPGLDRVASPPQLAPSKLRHTHDSDEYNNFGDNGSSTIGGLGNPIELPGRPRATGESLSYGDPMFDRPEDNIRTLHPIVDLPTPLDEPSGSTYFPTANAVPKHV